MSQYRKATGLETLFGYLYLNNEHERLQELVDEMILDYIGKAQ